VLYRGKITGTSYRFGNNESHRRRNVYAQDAEYFLSIKGQFRKIDPVVIQPVTVPVDTFAKTQPAPVVVTAFVVPTVKENATVQKEPENDISFAELKKRLPDMKKQDMAVMLAKERAGTNRVSIITLLERGLKK
jgi:hypothetical protein